MNKEKIPLFDVQAAIDIGIHILLKVANEIGIDNLEDFEYFLDQRDMDLIGIGINGKKGWDDLK